jgi:hypothetical protein
VPGDSERQFTADDLAADAAGAGTPVSTRLITDWVERGLLDRPRRRGLGRGKGTVATWPEDQRRLFLALLDQRRRGVKRQATLCNLPVTIWLDSEGLDHDYVPLRQVRRCLATWGSAYRAGPVRAARHAAEDLIEQQGMPHLSRRARRSLIDAVVTATGGGPVDRASLLAAARQAFQSERFAEVWVRTIEARLAAIQRLDAFEDETFHAARTMVNQAAAAYGDQQLDRTTSGEERRARAFELLTELSSNACLALLSALGFLELARRQGRTIPNNSPPRPLARPGGMARGGTAPHAERHANARRSPSRDHRPA